jgi:hypothetical protein
VIATQQLLHLLIGLRTLEFKLRSTNSARYQRLRGVIPSTPEQKVGKTYLNPISKTRMLTLVIGYLGYARGEGYGAIYLKRTSLAVDDNSPIRAMIRGTAVNSNGRTGGITRPSASGQETVIREAYRNAGDLPFSETSE